MKRPPYQVLLICLAALLCTGGTFTCESSSGNNKPNNDVNNPR